MVAPILTEELKNYMRHLMTITTNADTAYRIAREEMQMTRAEVRWAWRETARSELYMTLLNTWGTDRTPPAAWGSKADFAMRDNYMYIFNVKYYDTVTKEYLQKHLAAYRSERESFDDVWRDIQRVVKRYESTEYWVAVDWKAGGLWQKE